MNHIDNAERDLGADGWHKSWSGHNGGNCVEVKKLGDRRFALRQSTDPEGPALLFTENELDVFALGWHPHKDEITAS